MDNLAAWDIAFSVKVPNPLDERGAVRVSTALRQAISDTVASTLPEDTGTTVEVGPSVVAALLGGPISQFVVHLWGRKGTVSSGEKFSASLFASLVELRSAFERQGYSVAKTFGLNERHSIPWGYVERYAPHTQTT